jgi:hypothetical protein
MAQLRSIVAASALTDTGSAAAVSVTPRTTIVTGVSSLVNRFSGGGGGVSIARSTPAAVFARGRERSNQKRADAFAVQQTRARRLLHERCALCLLITDDVWAKPLITVEYLPQRGRFRVRSPISASFRVEPVWQAASLLLSRVFSRTLLSISLS